MKISTLKITISAIRQFWVAVGLVTATFFALTISTLGLSLLTTPGNVDLLIDGLWPSVAR